MLFAKQAIWFRSCAATAFLAAGVVGISGCNPTAETGSGAATTAADHSDHGHDHDDHGHDDGHGHGHEGPHGGEIVELGGDEYHAEIVHGEGANVTVYVLDGAGRNAVPIDAAEIRINLVHDEQPEQFTLTAAPLDGEPEGKSSRFQVSDEHLAEDLEVDGIVARLSLKIDGQQYTGKIEHDHDHAGHAEGEHDHDHDD